MKLLGIMGKEAKILISMRVTNQENVFCSLKMRLLHVGLLLAIKLARY